HSGSYVTRLVGLQIDRLGTVAVELERNLFEVEDDVRGVLNHAGDRLELVQHAFNANRGDRRAFNRRQQHAPQGVADGGAESALKRLRVKPAVFVGECLGVSRETLGLLKSSPKNHVLPFLSIPLRWAHALRSARQFWCGQLFTTSHRLLAFGP